MEKGTRARENECQMHHLAIDGQTRHGATRWTDEIFVFDLFSGLHSYDKVQTT